MSKGRLSRADGSGLRLEGELGFATARALWRDAADYLPAAGTVSIDLAGVTRADSAGVALLIHWTRIQRDHGGGVEFVNIPVQMRSIARVSGVDGILPLSDQ